MFKETLNLYLQKGEKYEVKSHVIKFDMKQMKLFSEKIVREFGGSLSKNAGKRKGERPLVFSRPTHLVLKTSKARGRFAFSPTDHRLKALIHKMGRKFGVKIYSSAQNWSHIHLVIRLRDRNSYRAFIRALTGAMVLKLKAEKGFFDLSPYTKVASWGRQFKTLKSYADKNTLQALGLLNALKQCPPNSKSSSTNQPPALSWGRAMTLSLA